MHKGSHGYTCSRCRKENRLELITQVINELQNEDKNGYYIEEFWLETEQLNAQQSKQYLRQIKNPICFNIIRRRLDNYLINPEQLKNDCLQIFLNAKNFNRQNTQIYKDAEKMYTVCLDIINNYLLYLEKQALAQEKENLFNRLVWSKSLFCQQLHRRGSEARLNEGEELRQFEELELPDLVEHMSQEIFIQEEHQDGVQHD